MSRPTTQHKRATYPVYKPSGMDWVGDIPEHWEIRRLKTVARFGYGDSLAADDRVAGPYNVYGSNGVVDQHDRANTQCPCLIIGRKGSFGKVAFSDKPCFAIDTTYFVDSRLTVADLRWLYYSLQWLRLDAISRDSAVPGLSREDAYNNRLAFCTLDEQRAIAAFLDRETVRIDALIEKKRRQIELLQEKRSALISHTVTKGLNPNAKMKDSGIEWLGEIPRHWEVHRLKYTVNLVNMKVDGADNDLPYTGLEHIESWTGKRIAVNGNATSEGQANLYRRGDVLFGKLRPYLAKSHACDSDGICTGELLVLRPMAMAQKFLLDYVLNPTFISVVDSSTYGAKMPRANWDFIGNLPALVPPPDEQRAIASFLDRETARIDALIEKVEQSIELLREYRTALISAAVTGKIDVRGELP
ncbi:MAG: restriction endonuclease subunit S [Desulfobacterales bacterium]